MPYDALPIQKATVLLGDTYSSELFLQSLYREVAEKGLAVLLLTSPYAEDIPDALYFYQERELFIKEEYAKTSRLPLQKGICLSAFGKDADSCSGPDPVTEEKNLLSLAFIQLRKAGEYHFALEEIYKKAMDYTALENYRLSLIPHILSYLE
ncbi:MAG: hypothetical protein MJ078_04380 [Clostridia bacterium]|nr:hypothetical protein [Clostridia bacterium]